MSEVQEIEKPKQNRIKFIYVISALVISCLMIGTAFGMMISANTPSGFPTVIEPGSMVSGYSFVIFKDGATTYAVNGTSGEIAVSDTNSATVIQACTDSINGGTIYVRTGNYSFVTPLVIASRQITIIGDSQAMPNAQPESPNYTSPYGTRFYGDVTVEAPNVWLNYLSIIGELTFTSNADFTSIADFCGIKHVFVYGNMMIHGLLGGSAMTIPYQIDVSDSYILGIPNVNAVSLTNDATSGGLQHIYFSNTVIFQDSGGSAIWVKGCAIDVRLTNCLISTNSAIAVLNLTGGEAESVTLIDSQVELQGSNTQVFLSIDPAINNYMMTVSVTDTFIDYASHLRYLVRDMTTSYPSAHNVVFTHLNYDGATLRVRAGISYPTTNLIFRDCFFHTPTNVALVIETVGGSWVGQFINCVHVNPVGLMATPFAGVNSDWMQICLASAYTPTNSIVASKNYTVRDVDVLVTSTGGTGVSITIWDAKGNSVLTGLSSLNRTYMPIGYAVNFGGFSVSPTVVVEGL